MNWWLYTTTTPPADEDCINNPDGCTCRQALDQCREESYMCEESMRELQRVIPGVYEENYRSKFDHPLVNTLAVHTAVKLRGSRAFSTEAAANILCTKDEVEARDDCFAYFHRCYGNQERLSQWYRTRKAEILKIDSSPLKL